MSQKRVTDLCHADDDEAPDVHGGEQPIAKSHRALGIHFDEVPDSERYVAKHDSHHPGL